MRRNFYAFFIGLATVACGTSDSPTTSTEVTQPVADTRTIQDDPSFQLVIQEVFDRRGCASVACHGSALSGGLDLRTGASYAALVNVPAVAELELRVIPGDPDMSYLVVKLEGTQLVGFCDASRGRVTGRDRPDKYSELDRAGSGEQLSCSVVGDPRDTPSCIRCQWWTDV